MSKPELEFFPVNNTAWRPMNGSKCTGVDERVLADYTFDHSPS